MEIIVPAKHFNTMVRSAKKIIKPNDFRRVAQRIHFQIFPSAPGVYYLRTMISDGYVLCEDVIEAVQVLRDDGPRIGSFELPRLAAKSDVVINVTEDNTAVSFDEVTFTYRHMRLTKDEQEPSDALVTMVKKAQSVMAKKEGRISICCNPKLLMAAVEAFGNCHTMRIDLGTPTDPILLTADAHQDKIFRMVMPMRSAMSDQTYRDGMSRGIWPVAANLADPPAHEQKEEDTDA